MTLTAGAGGDRGTPYESAGVQGSSDMHPHAEPGAASETNWVRIPKAVCYDSCNMFILRRVRGSSYACTNDTEIPVLSPVHLQPDPEPFEP